MYIELVKFNLRNYNLELEIITDSFIDCLVKYSMGEQRLRGTPGPPEGSRFYSSIAFLVSRRIEKFMVILGVVLCLKVIGHDMSRSY